MKASDMEIGKGVQLILNKKKRGTVIGNKLSGSDLVVAVEWQDGSLAKVNVNDLKICLSLEEEFELVKNQVNDKLAEAAALILAARDLAQENGKELLDPEYGGPRSDFDIDCIESAMSEAGWNTSSWYC